MVQRPTSIWSGRKVKMLANGARQAVLADNVGSKDGSLLFPADAQGSVPECCLIVV